MHAIGTTTKKTRGAAVPFEPPPPPFPTLPTYIHLFLSLPLSLPVEVGNYVTEDEVIAEIETDKVRKKLCVSSVVCKGNTDR